ncbi:MAG: exodeoxyribonuclease VII small subunit [Pseudomonadota bacterium]|nr:exodeoxyribonuclease VII small subunit [Pseudomonadota bacterium]
MAKSEKNPLPKDFESALQELETLVADMESGRLNLEAALAAYKRGSELAAYCQKTLDAADQQVKVLDNGVLKGLDTGEGND